MNAAGNHKSTQFVAGLSTTIDELRSLLWLPLSQPQVFTSRGMKAPKGVLLHGPSGVGKTGLAKQFLLEVETTLHCHTQYIHCASLQSKSEIVGEAEAALSKLFQSTQTRSPSLLVLDDVHLICSKRGSGSSSQGMDRLAATLLALLDGVEANNKSDASSLSSTLSPSGNVVILAVTTNPSLLDPALRRPGRLDAEVEVPLPEDVATRAEIIQFHMSTFNVELSDDLMNQNELLEIAKAAKGFNGADCMLAVKEAIRCAILETSEANVVLRKLHLLNAMRSIKPSAIKSISVEIPQVLWSSIGGMEAVKRELREAIELPMSHSDYFERLRVPPPRGILLYGPPGCSKTLMARALATEGNMNFLAVKGPELLSKWLGESERALSSLFRRARMASPAIVFFDEIDAIASKRGGGDSASSGRLLSQLLTELDGVNSTGVVGSPTKKQQCRVVIVGATNRPDLLDTALTRPGRIDRMIYVGPPDAESRAQIIHITLQKSCCSNDIDISILAADAMTGGFSGAEMVAICRDAALLALEESESYRDTTSDASLRQPMIAMQHLVSAIAGMQRQITPSMIDFYSSYQETYRNNNRI
jgi:SpoVK/Ycf46/Vps4 family AAA+-type ATPase